MAKAKATQQVWARYSIEGTIEIRIPTSANPDEAESLLKEAIKKNASKLVIKIDDWHFEDA